MLAYKDLALLSKRLAQPALRAGLTWEQVPTSMPHADTLREIASFW